MLEAVRALAGDGRPALARDEVAQQQIVEDGLEILDVGQQVLDGALPEDPADHRRSLEQPLLVPPQAVDAGGDHRLQRVGDPLRRGAALEEHPCRLLDEERVALGLLEQRLALGRRQLPVGEQRVEQLLALLGSERLELRRGGAQAAAAPARANVEQFRTGEAEDHQRRVLDALGQVLDQLEQRLLGPVDVLEDEDQRPRVGELGSPLARCPGDLLLAPLGLDSLEHADGEREQVGNRVVAALGAQLRDRLLDRVVVRDPGRDLDHLGERPVGDALAVGKRAADEDARLFDALEELACKPALPHAGLAVDREEVRALVPDHAAERVLEQLQLELAGDERRCDRGRAAVAFQDLQQPPGELRLGEALQVDRADLLGLDHADGQPSGEGPNEDLSRRGGLLEPRRDVDGLAGGEGRVGLVGDDLARLDPDPRLQPELVYRVEDRGRGAHSALGVVLVRLRNPERSHDGVAGELLDDAAVRRDAVGDVLEERVDTSANDLRIAGGDELRGAHEVDEDDGCKLAFHSVIVVTRGRVTAVAARSARVR